VVTSRPGPPDETPGVPEPLVTRDLDLRKLSSLPANLCTPVYRLLPQVLTTVGAPWHCLAWVAAHPRTA